MPSSHLILCCLLLLLPLIPPNIRVFSNESTLCMRWPKYWSFSFSISPSNEHPGLISFRMDWLDLLAVQGTLNATLELPNSSQFSHHTPMRTLTTLFQVVYKANRANTNQEAVTPAPRYRAPNCDYRPDPAAVTPSQRKPHTQTNWGPANWDLAWAPASVPSTAKCRDWAWVQAGHQEHQGKSTAPEQVIRQVQSVGHTAGHLLKCQQPYTTGEGADESLRPYRPMSESSWCSSGFSLIILGNCWKVLCLKEMGSTPTQR